MRNIKIKLDLISHTYNLATFDELIKTIKKE